VFASGQSMWGLWWTKRHWWRFSPGTSVSLANHHSTNFSIIIITRGWHNRPIGGRSAEWTQLDSTPTIPIKKKIGKCRRRHGLNKNGYSLTSSIIIKLQELPCTMQLVSNLSLLLQAIYPALKRLLAERVVIIKLRWNLLIP
jgi:hypothetical protein